ncbi:NAD(P)-dependent oxidoreductase [Halalkalicoccus salilacus]|uniref:NAD(P)-dependent oxidoreductase n=1 Tax=Halalkalicoccus sp. GCM10025704 TaxID=3252662 RepID=UPI0036F31DBD
MTAALTDETRGTFNEAAFDTMRDHVLFVNTARGPIVETTALIDALKTVQVTGASLEVFETEPLLPDSPLHELDNVITTPHIAAMSEEYRERGINTLARNTLSFLRGRFINDEFLAVNIE